MRTYPLTDQVDSNRNAVLSNDQHTSGTGQCHRANHGRQWLTWAILGLAFWYLVGHVIWAVIR
jgi:hypothetical protein